MTSITRSICHQRRRRSWSMVVAWAITLLLLLAIARPISAASAQQSPPQPPPQPPSPKNTKRPIHYYNCRPNFDPHQQRLSHKYCNSSLPLKQRLEDLLSRLTPFEKTLILGTDGLQIPRLGLPKLCPIETTHGVLAGECIVGSKNNSTGCATSFPSGVGLGATFHKDLWQRIGTAIGVEARGFYNSNDVESYLYSLDPNINLMRDPRWGRAQEVPGEDPYLTGEYAVHLVKGMQGTDDSKLLSAATVKHFSLYDLEGYIPRTDPGPIPSGYCDTPGGCQRWNSDSIPPIADFVDYYLEPFRQVITRGKPAAIMCSYNAVYGKPTCADSVINNELVRKLWNFTGFFVSDCTALELMQNVKWDNCQHPWPSEGGSCVPEPFVGGHNYTHTVDDTIHTSLHEGGIDMNCGALYQTNLFSAFQNGAVTEADIDLATRRILQTIFQLGMLDPPKENQPYNTIGPEQVDSAYHRQLALQAARESIVLLKNEPTIHSNNKPLLPILSAAKKSIAFIGPHANSSQSLLSNYHGTNTLVNENTPLLDAIRSGLKVKYALGAQICDYDYGKNPGFPNMPCDKAGINQTLIKEATTLAKQVDTVVLFLGSDQTTEAENFDRSSLQLAGNGCQQALLEAITQVNPNTVVVLIHGGPIVFDDSATAAKVPAILTAFYPGELGGPAILDVLTGKYNPGGKLPYTMYPKEFVQNRDIRNVDLTSQQGITHLYYNGPVFFPFGHGLSYTTFEYTWLMSVSDTFDDDESTSRDTTIQSTTTTFKVRVKNTGTMAGDAVCLGFLRNPVYNHNSLERKLRTPRAKLFGFDRIHLRAGEAADVLLDLPVSTLALIDENSAERILPSGGIEWTVEIGDIVTPARKRLHFFRDSEEEQILESNDIVRQRYEEWMALSERGGTRLRSSIA